MLDRRTYVLDTSVLLSSPSSLFSFREHEVVLPIVVVQELERKRNDPELGGAARTALRTLEDLRASGGNLQAGVQVSPEGGTLRIEVNHAERSGLPEALRTSNSSDTRILAVANGLKADGCDVVVVSKDLPMRILSSVLCGLPAEDYRGDQVPDSGYTGIVEVSATREGIDRLYQRKTLPVEDSGAVIAGLPVHSGLVLTCPGGSALATLQADGCVRLVHGDAEAFGVRGRSAEQRIALAHLTDPEIGVVSVGGPGGTGKSLLALAAGLEAVVERRTHKRVVVFRPLYAVGGQDLGYLPGAENDKMHPWAAAVFDALDAFCSQEVIDDVVDRGIIEVLPLTHIRGRTFTDSIVIVDEAQNLERHVLLTALSRTGDNSRVFLTHDVAQRDNLRVGRHDGVAAVVERLKGESLFAHINLSRSERSPVAALVTRLLDTMD